MKKSLGLITVSLSVFLFLILGSCQKQNKELRVLAWVGYEEKDIVQPFEKETGIKVLTETFVGADKMFAKLSKNPDAYDVVVIDPEYISKLHKAGLLSELNKKDFDFSDYVKPLKDFPLCTINNKFYAVLVRYGINALVYNSSKLTKKEVSTYKILWDPKVKGKVGIWDWYLPEMGVLSCAQNLNKDNPFQLNDEQFNVLANSMEKLKPQVKAIMGSFSDINNALVRGDVWVVPGLGEHTAAVLSEQGYPIDWLVPKEGGIMWIETLGIPKKSKNRAGAIEYIKYLQRPEVQAKLTWRKAYRSNIPNIKGIKLLTKRQQDLLKVHNANEAEKLINSVHVRLLPTDEKGNIEERKWQMMWQKFKSE